MPDSRAGVMSGARAFLCARAGSWARGRQACVACGARSSCLCRAPRTVPAGQACVCRCHLRSVRERMPAVCTLPCRCTSTSSCERHRGRGAWVAAGSGSAWAGQGCSAGQRPRLPAVSAWRRARAAWTLARFLLLALLTASHLARQACRVAIFHVAVSGARSKLNECPGCMRSRIEGSSDRISCLLRPQ